MCVWGGVCAHRAVSESRFKDVSLRRGLRSPNLLRQCSRDLGKGFLEQGTVQRLIQEERSCSGVGRESGRTWGRSYLEATFNILRCGGDFGSAPSPGSSQLRNHGGF